MTTRRSFLLGTAAAFAAVAAGRVPLGLRRPGLVDSQVDAPSASPRGYVDARGWSLRAILFAAHRSARLGGSVAVLGSEPPRRSSAPPWWTSDVVRDLLASSGWVQRHRDFLRHPGGGSIVFITASQAPIAKLAGRRLDLVLDQGARPDTVLEARLRLRHSGPTAVAGLRHRAHPHNSTRTT